MRPAARWFGRAVFDGILAAAIVIGWVIRAEHVDSARLRAAHDPGAGWDAT